LTNDQVAQLNPVIYNSNIAWLQSHENTFTDNQGGFDIVLQRNQQEQIFDTTKNQSYLLLNQDYLVWTNRDDRGIQLYYSPVQKIEKHLISNNGWPIALNNQNQIFFLDNNQLKILDLPTGTIKVISFDSKKYNDPYWLPTSKKLYFISSESQDKGDKLVKLFQFDLASSSVQEVSNLGNQPDSEENLGRFKNNFVVNDKYLAWTETEMNQKSAINILDLSNNKVNTIASLPVEQEIGSLKMSNQYLVWDTSIKGQHPELFAYNLGTSQLHQVLGTDDAVRLSGLYDEFNVGKPSLSLFDNILVFPGFLGEEDQSAFSNDDIYLVQLIN
jgi:hypothetical protein